MKYGVNLLLFSDSATPAVLRRFPALREMGFDGVEIPIFDPENFDTKEIRSAADRAGLELTVSSALPPGCSFYSESSKNRAAAAFLRRLIDATEALGAKIICGPLYKPVGDCDESSSLAMQRRRAAKAIEPLARVAAEKGIVLAFEPLNRFETNFMNLAEDGVDFCRMAGSEGTGLLLDTFHMHIEESDTAKAILETAEAGFLAHFHASENDRGTAGSGQVRWDAAAQALRRTKYNGWITLESFSQTNREIRKAVSCWRPFYKSDDEFLQNGLAFVKSTFETPKERTGRRSPPR